MMHLSKYGMLNKSKRLTAYGLLLLAFLIGLAFSSPFFQRKIRTLMSVSDIELSDTTNMQIANGIYSGSIIKGTTKRHGYGVFTKSSGNMTCCHMEHLPASPQCTVDDLIVN